MGMTDHRNEGATDKETGAGTLTTRQGSRKAIPCRRVKKMARRMGGTYGGHRGDDKPTLTRRPQDGDGKRAGADEAAEERQAGDADKAADI